MIRAFFRVANFQWQPHAPKPILEIRRMTYIACMTYVRTVPTKMILIVSGIMY